MTRETTTWMEEVLGLRRTRVQKFKDPNSSVCLLRQGHMKQHGVPLPPLFLFFFFFILFGGL